MWLSILDISVVTKLIPSPNYIPMSAKIRIADRGSHNSFVSTLCMDAEETRPFPTAFLFKKPYRVLFINAVPAKTSIGFTPRHERCSSRLYKSTSRYLPCPGMGHCVVYDLNDGDYSRTTAHLIDVSTSTPIRMACLQLGRGQRAEQTQHWMAIRNPLLPVMD